jgi:YD repeat-containing protein
MKSLKLVVLSIGILISNLLYSQTKTTYKYDVMNRITEVRFADGGFESYSYDKVGNRKSMTKVIPPPPPSSVQNTDKQDIFKIYPNPTSGVFSLEGSIQKPTESRIVLYDISGRVIKSIEIPKGTEIKQQIDISNVPNGNYMLVFSSGEVKRSWTIIKQ